MGQNVNSVGLSRRHITTSIENSLERLRTDYVDLYQVQFPGRNTPCVARERVAIAEMVRVMRMERDPGNW